MVEPPATARYDRREIDGLPAPVQRFFRGVLTDGQPIVTAVSLQHSGSVNMSGNAQQWKLRADSRARAVGATTSLAHEFAQ